MIIGEIIKRRRTALDLTQVELAEKAKITQAKISQIENGANDNVTIDVLRKLAKALNCVVVDLLPDKDKQK
jgi:transcriptional regulator with XRE-family HTH domain